MLRISAVLAIALILGGCGRSLETKEAVRQGVLDYLAGRSNLNVSSMDVEVVSVSFLKDQADATVAFRPKDSNAQSMAMRYTLERKGSRWVVKEKSDVGQNPHGQALPPGHPPIDSQKLR